MRVRSGKWNYFAALLIGATLLAGSGIAQDKANDKSKKDILSGTVTDSMCGAKHTMMKGTSDKDCTIACVKMGSKYGLVVGDKVYELDAKEGDLEKFAGAKAKVTGTVDGTTVHVSAVGPA